MRNNTIYYLTKKHTPRFTTRCMFRMNSINISNFGRKGTANNSNRQNNCAKKCYIKLTDFGRTKSNPCI